MFIKQVLKEQLFQKKIFTFKIVNNQQSCQSQNVSLWRLAQSKYNLRHSVQCHLDVGKDDELRCKMLTCYT